MTRVGFLLLIVVAVFASKVFADCGCGFNEEYTDCLDPCPERCFQEPEYCEAVCDGEGCQCKPGFKLNYYDQCVWPDDCGYT